MSENVVALPTPTAQASPEIEAWLDSRGVRWEFVANLDLGLIDKAASLANQARLEPVVEEVVERYAADMERGDTFPPILAYRRAKGPKVTLIGGNHRVAAAGRAYRQQLAAYIVDAAGELVTRLTYEDNRRHGLPPSEDERLLQAAHLVACGTSQATAAEVVGVSQSKVSRHMQTVKADRRANDLGIKGWTKLAKSSRWRLAALHSDPVLDAAARVALTTDMSTEDVYSLVTKVGDARSDAEALSIVSAVEEERAEARDRSAGGITRQRSARSRLMDALLAITSLDVAEVIASCATADHRLVLGDRIDAAARRLHATRKALG